MMNNGILIPIPMDYQLLTAKVWESSAVMDYQKSNQMPKAKENVTQKPRATHFPRILRPILLPPQLSQRPNLPNSNMVMPTRTHPYRFVFLCLLLPLAPTYIYATSSPLSLVHFLFLYLKFPENKAHKRHRFAICITSQQCLTSATEHCLLGASSNWRCAVSPASTSTLITITRCIRTGSCSTRSYNHRKPRTPRGSWDPTRLSPAIRPGPGTAASCRGLDGSTIGIPVRLISATTRRVTPSISRTRAEWMTTNFRPGISPLGWWRRRPRHHRPSSSCTVAGEIDGYGEN